RTVTGVSRMNWGRNWTLVLLALTLPAAVGTPAAGQTTAPPEAARPAAADTIRLVPTTAAESLLTTSTVPAGERWSLARCVQTALEKNADIKVAHARSRQASGSALGGWSGIIPSVTTEASYTQIRPDKARSQLFDPSGTFLGVNTKQEFSTLSATASSNVISAPSIGEKRRRDHLHRGSEFDEIETRNN